MLSETRINSRCLGKSQLPVVYLQRENTCCLLSRIRGRAIIFRSDIRIGIPSHEVHRIFENFHRAHDQKGRSFEGTGMVFTLSRVF
jgi:K+-sensing histidine kinase KdpD